jgi:hypothetical protein
MSTKKRVDWDYLLLGNYSSFRRFLFLEFGPGMLGICAMLAGILILSISIFGPLHCRAYTEARGLQYEWGFWAGCMVTLRGQRLGIDEIVAVERNGIIRYEPKPVIFLKDGNVRAEDTP